MFQRRWVGGGSGGRGGRRQQRAKCGWAVEAVEAWKRWKRWIASTWCDNSDGGTLHCHSVTNSFHQLPPPPPTLFFNLHNNRRVFWLTHASQANYLSFQIQMTNPGKPTTRRQAAASTARGPSAPENTRVTRSKDAATPQGARSTRSTTAKPSNSKAGKGSKAAAQPPKPVTKRGRKKTQADELEEGEVEEDELGRFP